MQARKLCCQLVEKIRMIVCFTVTCSFGDLFLGLRKKPSRQFLTVSYQKRSRLGSVRYQKIAAPDDKIAKSWRSLRNFACAPESSYNEPWTTCIISSKIYTRCYIRTSVTCLKSRSLAPSCREPPLKPIRWSLRR